MSTILVVCRWWTCFSEIKNSTGKAAQLCDRKSGFDVPFEPNMDSQDWKGPKPVQLLDIL